MPHLQQFRAGKPGFYPDQTIYAEYACAEFGLTFEHLDRGTGVVFRIASSSTEISFGAGRCSWFPQNNATASSLASDKYFTNLILERADVPTFGGQYFFLHDRHRAHRPPGHDRSDAEQYFRVLDASAFIKPLQGSRGDFAQPVHGEAALQEYLDRVSRYYDAVLMQRIFSGLEYRVFLLDDEVLYTARKYPPAIMGDGANRLCDLLAEHNAVLQARGLSPVTSGDNNPDLTVVLPEGERWEISGRMNLSAGGRMILEALSPGHPAYELARHATNALGLRVAAVDLFIDIDGKPELTKIIEVNANPSIRLLEDSGRSDLILKIWRHTFVAMGLLDV